MEYSQAAFSRMASVTRQAIYNQIRKGILVLNANKKLDDEDPLNKAYLINRRGEINYIANRNNLIAKEVQKSVAAENEKLKALEKKLIDKKYSENIKPIYDEIKLPDEHKDDEKAVVIPDNVSDSKVEIEAKPDNIENKPVEQPGRKIEKQITEADIIRIFSANYNKMSTYYNGEANLKNFVSDDLANLDIASIQRLKHLEDIKAKRLKYDESRKDLISRDLVKNIFLKIYNIDTAELRTLPASLTPQISSIAEIKDPTLNLKIEEVITKEIFRILKHIKYLIGDFLQEIKKDPIKSNDKIEESDPIIAALEKVDDFPKVYNILGSNY